MSRPLRPTELRSDLYRVLDEVLDTGVPREILRRGETLWIVPATGGRRRLADLPRRNALACTPDELVATTFDWEPGEEAS